MDKNEKHTFYILLCRVFNESRSREKDDQKKVKKGEIQWKFRKQQLPEH